MRTGRIFAYHLNHLSADGSSLLAHGNVLQDRAGEEHRLLLKVKRQNSGGR